MQIEVHRNTLPYKYNLSMVCDILYKNHLLYFALKTHILVVVLSKSSINYPTLAIFQVFTQKVYALPYPWISGYSDTLFPTKRFQVWPCSAHCFAASFSQVIQLHELLKQHVYVVSTAQVKKKKKFKLLYSTIYSQCP